MVVLCLAGLAVLLVIAWNQTQGTPEGLPAPLDDGEVPGDGISYLTGLGLFVALPVAILVLVSALVALPDLVRGPRYRPTRGWQGEAVWFAGPDDAETAVREATAAGGTRGGARGSW